MASARGKVSQSYSFCSVCRRNHDEGRKHIFTTQHKNRLAQILSKFSKKVRAARRVLQKPRVVDGELEPGAELWCYCCQQEVAHHVTDGVTTVEWGGLLEHMTSPQHHKKTRHFWWFHGAEQSQLQTFLLFSAEYKRYKSLVADALQTLETQRKEKLKKVADELRAKEQLQLAAAMEPPAIPSPPIPVYRTVRNQYSVMQNPTGWHEGQRVWGGGIVKYRPNSDQLLPWPCDSLHQPLSGPSSRVVGRYTMAASGGSMVSIGAQVLAEGEGNVHSGATPPWLQEDSDSEEGHTPIGPPIEAFLKHKERLRQAGRNPKRVGADFHRNLAKEDEDESWLPSFGRVWNHGPRSHSLMEFQREVEANKKTVLSRLAGPPLSIARGSSSDPATPVAMKDTNPPAEPSTCTAPAAAMRLPQIKPYVRKRPTKGLRSSRSGQPVGGTSGRTEAAQSSNQIKHDPLPPSIK